MTRPSSTACTAYLARLGNRRDPRRDVHQGLRLHRRLSGRNPAAPAPEDFSHRPDQHFKISEKISTRDRDAIYKTMSGLLKLIFPNGGETAEDVEELLAACYGKPQARERPASSHRQHLSRGRFLLPRIRRHQAACNNGRGRRIPAVLPSQASAGSQRTGTDRDAD